MLELINAGLTDINFLRDYQGMQNARNRQLENTAQQNAAGVIPNPLQGESGVSNKKAADTTKSDNKKQEQAPSQSKAAQSTASGELTDEQKREVQKLKAIDQKVRQHEMAHLSAAQGIAVSGATFQYQKGPDGINYAVGGEVNIDTSKDKDPQKTIEKARKIIAAANAPADPSPQDRQVAAQAQAMQAQAQQELARQTLAQNSGTETTTNTKNEGKTQNNTTTGTNRPNPGIQEYQKNQSFAPKTASQTKTTQPGFTLDMVA